MAPVQPRVVIIGAGIVGCALADEITHHGWTDVTVLEQGPLFATGGSTSHAPGLVFQVNPAKTMTEFARYTVAKYAALTVAGRRCFDQVGGLEVAGSPERWAELKRKHGWASAWGIPSRLRTPGECAELHPLLDPDQIHGGFHIPGDGLAEPVPAAEAQARLAQGRGARFVAHHPVTGIRRSGGRVQSVVTESGEFPADVVVCCAGIWGPRIGAMVGMPVPLVPMAHQYVKSAALPALTDLAGGRAEPAGERTGGRRPPILRHQDQDLYFREHGDRVGIGAYGHRPMPLPVEAIPAPGEALGVPPVMPSVRPFTPDDFEPWWRQAAALLPALGQSRIEEGINGLFSFTPDGMPLLGESPDVRGFWLAEAVWITHSAGVAKAVAEWLVEGQPRTAVHECDVDRFDEVQLAPPYVLQRGCQSFVEVYDIVHPRQPLSEPRPLRVSPFHARQCALGAYFLEADGWERPQWYETNAALLAGRDIPGRGAWASRFWSPIAGAEAQVTRERVALYDMSSLRRCEVRGPGALAFLRRMTTGRLDTLPGHVTYALMLNPDGGVRGDATVARLEPDLFQVAVNSELDLAWLRRHQPEDGSVQLRDLTPGSCRVGVWGPRARDLVQPLTDTDLSPEDFGSGRARRAYVDHVPVTALRLSSVGELGWELSTRADLGLRLWDTLWRAGQRFGVIAAGHAAFDSLRLEMGHRAWGIDVTAEHNPYEAGLGFAVEEGGGDFVGRVALERLGGLGVGTPAPRRRLCCLTLDDPETVVMGSEPVYAGDAPVGYVTSADYGYTVGASIAYAWLPAELAEAGRRVEIEYFGEKVPAVVTAEPLVDPEARRVRG